jgi:predicted porin
MKKKIGAAFAAAAAAAAPHAMAQADDPVTLYGRVYVMFDVVEAKGGTAAPLLRRNRVSDQSSLLGVRGSENLGAGMKAFYQLETGFVPDGASGPFAQRNSAVGLQHERWGSLLMGRWDMPFKLTQVAVVDPFTDLSIADITGTAINQGNFSNREPNVVQYWSPEWAGFSVKLAYTANETRIATRNPYKYGGSVAYGKGDYYIAYAYEKHHDYSDGVATTGVSQEGNGIAGYFRLGTAKIMGQYGTYTKTGAKTQKGYALGLDWVFVGNSHLLVLYQRSQDGGANNALQPQCDAIGIGYRYDFSRRTMFQANYVRVNNKTGNLCNFGAGALNIADGQDPRGIAAGVRHTF